MPSLYETTAIVGDVSSSNFTTLYNSSGLSAPNSGGGAISGNLNVAGNLTVQGASLLQGAVTLGSTLSTPNYTFPLPDGTTFQVLATDGSGNLYWTNVSALPGASYSIQADTATGGANLTLLDSAGGTDAVKFAAGTNITVSRTDANTITISTTADDIPNGTAAGEVLTWDGSAWTANNRVTSLTSTDRFIAEYKDTDTARGSSALFRRNYAATPYTAGLVSAIAFSFDSDSQPLVTQGAVGAGYDAANPSIFGTTSIDNFTTTTVVFDIDSTDIRFAGTNLILNADSTAAAINWNVGLNRIELTNDLYINGDLTVQGNDIKSSTGLTAITLDNNSIIVAGDVEINGGDLTTTAGVGNLFNTNAATVNIGNAANTEVNIGSPTGGSRVQIKPQTIVGLSTTQNVFDTVATTVNAFGAATAVNIGAATGVTTIEHDLTVQGGNINLNGAATAGVQPFLTFANQPQGVNSLYGIRGKSAQDDPWFVGAGSTGTDSGYLEIATGDNAGDPFGVASPIYVRQYNGYAGNQVPWYGGTATVVHELTLLNGSGDTVIPNNVTIGGDLAVNGGDITTTSVTGNLFNANAVVVNLGNGATTEVNLGNISSGRVQIKSPELDLNGGLLTFRSETTGAPSQNAEIRVERGTSADASLTWDESQDRWEFTNDLYVVGNYSQDGDSLTINADNTAVDSYLYMKGGSEYLKWDNAETRFEFSDALEVQGQITGTSNLDLNGNNISLRSGAAVDGDATIVVNRGSGVAEIKWNSTTDRWQTSVDGTTYLNIPNQNLDTTSAVSFTSVTFDNRSTFDTNATTTTSTATFTIDETSRNAIKSMIYIESGSDSHALEILIMRTSASAMMTTYGEMYTTTPLATFTADQSGGNIRIRCTPTSATSTTFSTVRYSLT